MLDHTQPTPPSSDRACFVGSTAISTTMGRLRIDDLARLSAKRDEATASYMAHLAAFEGAAAQALVVFDGSASRMLDLFPGDDASTLQAALTTQREALVVTHARELDAKRTYHSSLIAQMLPRVITRDPKTGEVVERPIVKVWQASTATALVDVVIDTVVVIEGNTSREVLITVRCTPEHVFIGPDAETLAMSLEGVKVYRLEGDAFEAWEVSSAQAYEAPDPVAVYDIEVEGIAAYCVSPHDNCCAALVHNSSHDAGETPRDSLQVERVFSKTWTAYTSREVTDPATRAEVAFTAPTSWSDQAVTILATKYARKTGVPVGAEPWTYGLKARAPSDGPLGAETDALQIFGRLAGCWAHWGLKLGYFDDANAGAFRAELMAMLEQQVAAPNSPQWFNTGLNWAYGITGPAKGHYAATCFDGSAGVVADPEMVRACTDSYTRPQAHACFIQSVEDDLVGAGGIMDLIQREARLFKFGSGTGTNFSRIRGKGEKLSGGGTSSGLLSFLRIGDRAAGAIKSGGTTRRAAKMVIVDVDHPDIEKFIAWKSLEKRKIQALRAAGIGDPTDFEDEATNTVSGQNGNNSVRLSDAFMQAVANGESFDLIARTTGEVMKTVDARELWGKLCEAAWDCADPGVQFHDTINKWNTCAGDESIKGSNPCQPGFAKVLTPKGVRTFDDIDVGSIVWTGKQWSPVLRKVMTGVKPVHVYHTRAGRFVGTAQHKVFCKGARVEVSQSQAVDTSQGPVCAPTDLDPQDIMDGLYLGDGFRRVDTPTKLLCVGAKDEDAYRDSEIASLMITPRPGYSEHAWEVVTTLGELPLTYERVVPEHFVQGSARKVRGFLRGLYAANGSVVVDARVVLKASSFEVIGAVQAMLSSLGIRSYYTVNKSKVVRFANGDYRCKQSYDLNITTDKHLFSELIGFLHPYKNESLERACARPKGFKPPKSTYDIVEVESLGELPVYDIEVEAEEHSYWTDGLLVSNCSEYMWLDDTACNLASLNLVKFMREDGSLDLAHYAHAVRLWTIVLDITVSMAGYPSERIAERSQEYRTLGLGYANLGGLLMRTGVPYDSEDGREIGADLTSRMGAFSWQTSAELAEHLGAFPAYERNSKQVLRVVNQHFYAAAHHSATHHSVNQQEVWSAAYSAVSQHGARNAQCTLLAPTGTIGLVMDCDTTGVEPDFALVKLKRLAGGGYFKLVNTAMSEGLRSLGYNDEQVRAITIHCKGTGSLVGAPALSYGWLRSRGFTEEMLRKIEDGLISAMHIRDVFNIETLGTREFTERLGAFGLTEDEISAPDFDLLTALGSTLGFTREQVRLANHHACGTGNVKHAPHLRAEHVAVFDCANDIDWRGHLGMMASAQPFLCGAISKTINMPATATASDISDCYLWGHEHGLKAVAVYRNNSKATQVLTVEDDGEDEQENEADADVFPVGFKIRLPSRSEPTSTAFANEVVGDCEGEAQRLSQAAFTVGSDGVSFTYKREPMKVNRTTVALPRGQREAPPALRDSQTARLKIAGESHHIIVGRFDDGRICELFVNVGKAGGTVAGWADAFALAVSLYLQAGGNPEHLISKLRFQRFEPAGFVTDGPCGIRSAKSPVDAIAQLLEKLSHKAAAPPSTSPTAPPVEAPERTTNAPSRQSTGEVCASCRSTNMNASGTCFTCADCGETTGCG